VRYQSPAISGANLSTADLSDADFSEARLGRTIFANHFVKLKAAWAFVGLVA
jgi:uncharacterized protein YjbI with pentapeptide repeats